MTPKCPDCKRDQDDCVCVDPAERIKELEDRLGKALAILGADTQIEAEANFVALRQERDALLAECERLKSVIGKWERAEPNELQSAEAELIAAMNFVWKAPE